MQRLVAAVLLVLPCCCLATYNNGFLYPFRINSLLECQIPNPFANLPGEPSTITEEVPIINIEPMGAGDVWLPEESGFRVPLYDYQNLDFQRLLEFYGDDFQAKLLAFEEPIVQSPEDVPLARETIPIVEEGSGGKGILFMEELRDDGFFEYANGLLARAGIIDPNEREIIGRWINSTSSTLGVCDVVGNWTELPVSFFPRFFAGGQCSGSDCSLPQGLKCYPDLRRSRMVNLLILRWDCCWSFAARQWRWDCGWRKVRFPVISDCVCSCRPVSTEADLVEARRLG